MSTLLSERRQPIAAPGLWDRLPAQNATPRLTARHEPAPSRQSPTRWTLMLDSIVLTLREWRRRSAERSELARLDERMIRDVGLDPGSVYYEASQSFWRTPRDWRN